MSSESANRWMPSIAEAGKLAKLNSVLRWAMWLCHVGIESSNLKHLVESLDYSEEALLRDKRFNAKLANLYGRNASHPADQVAVANIKYGGRLGNRMGTMDGWERRGRGPIQVTGLANQTDCQDYLAKLGVIADLRRNPELLSTSMQVAALSTVWYWDTRHINAFADAADVEGATRAINGGTNGLKERKEHYINDIEILKTYGMV